MERRLNGRDRRLVPALDVHETEDEYLVLIDLPGVTSEDVVVELTDQVLTISGSRAPVETDQALRIERPSGSFVRRLTLPKGVDADKAEMLVGTAVGRHFLAEEAERTAEQARALAIDRAICPSCSIGFRVAATVTLAHR